MVVLTLWNSLTPPICWELSLCCAVTPPFWIPCGTLVDPLSKVHCKVLLPIQWSCSMHMLNIFRVQAKTHCASIFFVCFKKKIMSYNSQDRNSSSGMRSKWTDESRIQNSHYPAMSSYVDCGCKILCYAICGELYTICYRADSQAQCFFSRTFFCIPRPDDGNPMLLTSYRSELGGLVTLLYIIHRICQYYNWRQAMWQFTATM